MFVSSRRYLCVVLRINQFYLTIKLQTNPEGWVRHNKQRKKHDALQNVQFLNQHGYEINKDTYILPVQAK